MELVLYRDWFPVRTGKLKPGAAELAGAELPVLAFTAGASIPAVLCRAVLLRTGTPTAG